MSHTPIRNARRALRPVAIAAALLLLAVVAAEAHDLFLKLDSYWLAPNARVRVRMLNGTFTRSENSVTRDRVRDLSVAGASGVTHPTDEGWRDAGDTTVFEITTGAPGTYVIGVSTNPKTLALAGAEFNAYLREEGVLDVLARRRARGELGRKARERYAKHVKAIVQVGDPRTDAYATALGYPAELVPLENPYALHVGDTLRVRALVDGAPAAGVTVIAGRQTTARERPRQRTVRADSAGIARIPLAGRGTWFVKFIRMAPVAGDSTLDYESKWATLTFGVR